MDKFGLRSYFYMISILFAGIVSDIIFSPILRSAKFNWPDCWVTIVAPVPGLALIGGIATWHIFRLEKAMREGQNISKQ